MSDSCNGVRRVALVASLAMAATAGSALAQNGSTYVKATANIFGYGLSTPQPGGGGGGTLANVIALNAGTGRVAAFSAGGMAGWGGALVNGPDGGNFSNSTNIGPVGPISGYNGPLSGQLVGVFIEAGDISALSAPGGMSYPDLASYSAADYAPGLRQVFFIGDGLTGTGSGSIQAFHVPDGAGFLVLGIADAWGFNADAGYYDDNVGGYETSYVIVPAPGAASMLGLAGLLAARRRRA
ncbi:MAG: hypothetical protein JNM86_11815 [Phycisphaerae bacterium]|nr:hypothetical protein [Phycisphaerae bacterium]